jgi:hypothetical protein
MKHTIYQEMIAKQLERWQSRKSRSLKEEWLEAALLLFRLDLDCVSEDLKKLYSSNPRGRPPFDPVCMLRAMLLMAILRFISIEKFALELRSQPRLAILAGFEPFKTPGVGTFYSFVDRLEDGPYEPNCIHKVKPSRLRKGKHRRNLKREKAEKEENRKKILSECDSITENLKDELLKSALLPRPQDYLHRLEDLLIKTSVIPSDVRGLLGDLKKMIISGDGSALPTGASSVGRPTCNCRSQGIYSCSHDRFYTDRTADWGFDSYRECYYFGHSYYHHIVSSSGHDLPVHISIGQASESDFTLSLKSLDRLMKAFSENKIDLSILAASYDAGHDAMGIYEYLNAKKINPVISLNPRVGQLPKPTGTAEVVNSQGIPLCPAGLAMRRHYKSKDNRIYFNCPVKRPTHENGEYIFKSHPEECPLKVLCQPDTKMGPIVYIRSNQDPRYYPPIARDSNEYKSIMNLRSGCERSNSMKKVVHGLERRPCRSATHYLLRLYLISICEHAKAWLAEDRKVLGLAWRGLIDLKNLPARQSAA